MHDTHFKETVVVRCLWRNPHSSAIKRMNMRRDRTDMIKLNSSRPVKHNISACRFDPNQFNQCNQKISQPSRSQKRNSTALHKFKSFVANRRIQTDSTADQKSSMLWFILPVRKDSIIHVAVIFWI